MSTFRPSSFPSRSANRFSRRHVGRDRVRRNTRRNRQRIAQAGVEQLEQRLALTVEVAFDNHLLNGPGEDWVVVVADSRQDVNADGVVASNEITQVGSDVFMMVASTPSRDLFVADNASFMDRITLNNVNGNYDNIYVYDGTFVNRNAFAVVNGFPESSFFGVPDKYLNDGIFGGRAPGYSLTGDDQNGYPFSARGAGTQTLSFMLPSEGIDWTEPVFGEIDLNTSALGGDIVNFTYTGNFVNGRPTFDFTGAIAETNVRVGVRSVGTVDPQIILDVSLQYDVTQTGIVAEPTMQITYDVDTRPATATAPNRVIVNAVNIGAARNGVPTIEVFDNTEHVYVPGTLRSNLQVRYGATFGLSSQVQESGLGADIPISFNNAPADQRNVTAEFGSFRYWDDVGVASVLDIQADGEFNTTTGLADFRIWVDSNPTVFRPFSFVMTRADVALQDTGNANDPDPFFTVPDTAANDFTLFPGHNLTTGLTVELSNPDSRISMESPLVVAAANGLVSLSAEEINVNAPVRAPGSFLVPDMQASSFGTISERMTVNASVSSNTFDIRMRSVRSEAPVGEMVGTMNRGLLNITQTGLLSNEADVLNGIPANPAASASLFVEMVDGDMYLEGRVVVSFQSYLIQSPEMTSQRFVNGSPETWSKLSDFPQWAPYQLTTASRLTGVDVGSIEGNTVAITLANDTLVLPDPLATEPFDPSRAFSVLDISTNVTRLRVQASDRENDLLEQPFPYLLTVREENGLIIDAVAASSEKIDIFADGVLTMLGKLESAGDVQLESTSSFTLSAPLSTRFGSITLFAPEINLQNSVRVLDGPQDERDTDILIQASEGDLLLQDAVSAINRVILRQEGDGEIAGSARVFADVLEVSGASDVSLRTRANRVAVRAPGQVSVDERDYGIFEIRDAANVTLVANGFDQIVRADAVYDALPIVGGRITPADKALISPALYADVYDTRVLTVSAPNGSVDVFHQGAQPLSVGDISAINNGTAREMVAAGSVSIRSTLAEITVVDAPTPTGSARNVRLATTAPLQSRDANNQPVDGYTNNSPGVLPGRLSNVRITRGGLSNVSGVEIDNVDVTSLRLGDRILVTQGHNDNNGLPTLVSNGIYRILSIYYPVTLPGAAPTYVELDLIRADEADTTVELGQKHYVRVAEGEQFGGAVLTADGSQSLVSNNGTPADVTDDFTYQSYKGWGTSPTDGEYAFSNIFENDVDLVPTVVRTIPSQTGYVTAMAVTQGVITGANFSPIQQTIQGEANSDIPVVDNVNLVVGDRVLVRYGATEQSNSSLVHPLSAGLYEVTSIGGAGTQGWQLKRYQGVDDDGDGALDRWYTGRVAIDQGTDRTAVTGEMFEVAMESLGYAALRYRRITEFTIDSADPFDSALSYKVDIGSNNPTAPLTYVVSTENGINSSNSLWFGNRRATGSFGRMLTLLQGNAAVNERTGEPQEQTLEFDPSVSRINLVQALPAIYRPISITAASGVTIDGTQIERTANGAVIRSGSVITSIGPVRAANALIARRLVRPGSFVGSQEVHGIQFLDTADGASISGLALGGFNNGAAIFIQGADNVDISGVRLGSDANGARLANKVGIEIQGASVSQDVVNGNTISYLPGSNEHTTIRGSTIVNSSEAGVVLGPGSDRVHLVGNTIGLTGQNNAIGVVSELNSEIPAYIGSASILGSTLVQLTGTVTAVGGDLVVAQPQTPAHHLQNTATITLNDSALARQMRPGMVIYDSTNDIVRTIRSVNVTGATIRQFVISVDNATATSTTGEGALYTIAGNPLAPVVLNPTTDFQLGHLAESVDENGVAANPGKVTVGDLQIRLPATINARDVYLGQSLSSAQPGIDLGTVIEEIRTSLTTDSTDTTRARNEETIVTLSRPITETGAALLLLGQPGANRFTGNADGIVLRGTSSSVVNSVITGSIYDGIRIESASGLDPSQVQPTTPINGLADVGTHVIGDALGTIPGLFPMGVLSEQNVSIYSNQLSGIRLTDSAFAALDQGGPHPLDGTADDWNDIDAWLDHHVRIRGNYIGFNPVISRAAGNGATGVSNIVVQLDPGDPADAFEVRIRELLLTSTEFEADGVTPKARLKASTVDGLDSQDNRHGIGGITGGGDTDRVTVPPRRPIIR